MIEDLLQKNVDFMSNNFENLIGYLIWSRGFPSPKIFNGLKDFILCDFWYFKSIRVFKTLNIRRICRLRCGLLNFFELFYIFGAL